MLYQNNIKEPDDKLFRGNSGKQYNPYIDTQKASLCIECQVQGSKDAKARSLTGIAEHTA